MAEDAKDCAADVALRHAEPCASQMPNASAHVKDAEACKLQGDTSVKLDLDGPGQLVGGNAATPRHVATLKIADAFGLAADDRNATHTILDVHCAQLEGTNALVEVQVAVTGHEERRPAQSLLEVVHVDGLVAQLKLVLAIWLLRVELCLRSVVCI